MKKFYLAALLSFVSVSLFSQTLFTFGNQAVGKDEFLRAYNKNKTPVTDKKKSLREYLDLYARFKLKVKAAQVLRLDTLPQLQYDIQSFRGQVEDSYMNDEKGMEALTQEAFERSQKDLHVLHFSVGIDSKMKPEDTLKAWKAMKEVYEEIKDGKMDYDEMVDDISSKYLKIKGTDFGFITAFSVPYEYENIIYGLKLGEPSKPYRSKNALHVFRVIEERKSAGRWKVAQILLAFPPGQNDINFKELQHRADSIYTQLKAGADFAELAKQYSDDKLTYLTGGEMAEFGTGKFELPYEKEVLKLTKDGDISKPFFTQFGFHILKRLGNTPTPADKTDATFIYELKQKILQDSRVDAAKEKFTKEVIKKIGFKKNAAVKDADIFKYADSISVNPTAERTQKFPVSNKTIFSFGKNNVKGSDWLNFVKDYKGSGELYKGETNKELLDKYINITALEFYKKHLDEYNTDFKYQMQEFREGNMLFEIMEKNVWGSAANDSAGLQKMYNQNKTKYLWAASADILLFNCKDARAASDAIESLKKGGDWKKIAEQSNAVVQADSGRYELSQITLPDAVKAEAGLISTPVVNNTDGTVSFLKILKLYPAGMQRSFEEAKGLVINDYQLVLEEKWIAELKKKYPVKVDEKVFQSLLK